MVADNSCFRGRVRVPELDDNLSGRPWPIREQLAALRQICLIPCEEYEDLEKAITAYSKRAARFR
jgi:hypothetical protein